MKPPDNMIPKKSTLDYIKMSPQYIIYIVLIMMFWMWTDMSKKYDTLADKIQNVQVTLAIQQTSSVAVGRLIEKVDVLEGQTAYLKATVENHRAKSTYDKCPLEHIKD